jgi:hypothetical protein
MKHSAGYVSPALLRPTRSMEQVLADTEAELRKLPLNSLKRGELISTIRWLEDEIDRRRG